MAAIVRRGLIAPISTTFTLATADDLDGTVDGTQYANITGATRVLVQQINNGTNGTAGIDVITVSHDGGITWAADATLMLTSADDLTGTVITSGVLNVAGTEPTLFNQWKGGPYEGPTMMRCERLTTTTNGTTWVTGAPTVSVNVIGRYTGAVSTATTP